MAGKSKSKKGKNKISKLIEKADPEEEENERELSHYMNDRVKLMKEVLKIIKPKKIKSMAPECIKHSDIAEINSMLLEELLGISNKRLKYIFNGQNVDEDSSSSTDPEEEKQPIDIISLDDISEDDFVIDVDADTSKKRKNHAQVKTEPKKIKKEKDGKLKAGEALKEDNLMSVLELLELQARARAIRSQLLLEANNKSQEVVNEIPDDDSDDAVIIESPKNDEIVITSSDSETEDTKKSAGPDKAATNESPVRKKRIKLIRDRFKDQDDTACASIEQTDKAVETVTVDSEDREEQDCPAKSCDANEEKDGNGGDNAEDKDEAKPSESADEAGQEEETIDRVKEDAEKIESEKNSFDDAIVINVDQADIDGIIID